MNRWHPLVQLILARFREFYREPEVIFWVYGFPLLLAVGLAVAFWNREPEAPAVDVQETTTSAAEVSNLVERLQADGLPTEVHEAQDCAQRLRTGKTAFYIILASQQFTYVYDPARAESVLARTRVDAVLTQWKAGIQAETSDGSGSGPAREKARDWKAGNATWRTVDALTTEPGSRYIDFLMPGIMGMNLMGGGLWGVGFVLVDMRVRKLLKRLLATPMRRGDFLLSILIARLVFILPEMLLLVLVGRFGFGVPLQGNVLTLVSVILLGAMAFSGIGLLVACRADKTETVSGLMNAVMLPMWLLSGIFFSSKHFPEVMQPFIQALPLTQLNDALREVMLEGARLSSIIWRLAILAGYALVCFALALKWFRWK